MHLLSSRFEIYKRKSVGKLGSRDFEPCAEPVVLNLTRGTWDTDSSFWSAEGNSALSEPVIRCWIDPYSRLRDKYLDTWFFGSEMTKAEVSSADSSRKLTKNEKRRLKEKEAKAKEASDTSNSTSATATVDATLKSGKGKRASRFVEPVVQVSYVSADVDSVLEQATSGGETKVTLDSTALQEFKVMFSKFAKAEELTSVENSLTAAQRKAARAHLSKSGNSNSNGNGYGEADSGDDDMNDDEDEDADMDTADEGALSMSRRKQRLSQRPSIAQLKQMVSRPEVVEAHDVTAADPQLLLFLKCLRHTVPVPQHWGVKKKYLSGKRGTEKPPFELPAFIADTGIDRIRQSLLAQEQAKKSKGKAREKSRPNMGKIDIDYQVLHDAFFKFQTKPTLSQHGDLYYEGREAEVGGGLKNKRPGGPFSEQLLAALGMESNSVPPPWLLAQQRYGPPPSYPSLKIPGLSAPIPSDGVFGYHQGGWGKPPVDEYGRPLYGDVFGTGVGIDEGEEIVDVGTRWGEMQATVDSDSDDDVDSSSSSSSDGESDTEEVSPAQLLLPKPEPAAGTTGTAADLSLDALEARAQENIDLRKRAAAPAASDEPQVLYRVLEQKAAKGKEGELFGSDRTYVVNAGGKEDAGSAVEEAAGGNGGDGGDGGDGGEDDAAAQAPKRKKARADGASKKMLDNFKF